MVKEDKSEAGDLKEYEKRKRISQKCEERKVYGRLVNEELSVLSIWPAKNKRNHQNNGERGLFLFCMKREVRGWKRGDER